jgi:[ribosomal protein S18]-alanine N-acetyltransferase
MPSEFTTRRLRAADLDRILAIEHECFGADAWDRNLFAEYLCDWGDLFLVAEGRRRVYGYVLACIRSRTAVPSAELVSIAVVGAARRQGAATVLLASIMRRLRRRAILRLSLMVKVTNTGAMAFYDRHGFSRIRRVPGYYEDGTDGFLMSRDL